MKTAIRNSSNLFTVLFIALALSSFTPANDTTGYTAPGEGNVEFKFIGNLESYPVYQLNLNSNEEDEYVISFRESDGTVVYSNIVKGNYSQRFLLRAEGGDNTLRMEVRSRKGNKARIFIIRRTESVVQENVVVKVQ